MKNKHNLEIRIPKHLIAEWDMVMIIAAAAAPKHLREVSVFACTYAADGSKDEGQ